MSSQIRRRISMQPAAFRAEVWLRLVFAVSLLALAAGSAVAQTVAQTPLSVGSVPGNLLLVPSVEWPTIDSMANLGDYDVSRTYSGYFDAGKCYNYSYSSTESERYFYPVSTTSTRTCSNSQQQWSGNYLNWAATQTIDPFRKALTGGYRVRDTATETWVEKARSDGSAGNTIYPDRRIPASGNGRSMVSGATPASWNSLTIRIRTLGNKMRFTSTGAFEATAPAIVPPPTIYNPAVHTTLDAGTVYELSVRVKVCDSSVGVESNCKQYSNGWKPEGLIQQYASRIRYSAFGYLNDSSLLRDGGVLRAKQKFVGENKIDPVQGTISNPNREWDPSTGVLVQNPDSDDASATTSVVGTTIGSSGVINYINKFGQMTSGGHKSYDPVSELYYTAIRYLKHQGNVPEYSSLSGDSATKYGFADGFPVITSWDDPIQYWCQNNAILGIGDVNTHRDKNLPGDTVMTDEPTRPATVSSDTTIDVVAATQKVADLEGITINTPFTGRENSAFIAGLAYDAHTKDLRSDLQDKQTVSTYWVDVREAQVLRPRATNQYWLAAKYGGFTVPDDYNPYGNTTSLPTSWWSTGGETLSTGDLRPDNFYVASEADKMLESLTRAFAKIAAETVGAGSSLSSSSTRLDTGTRTFQAQFFSGTWRGELKAYSIGSNGTLSSTPVWRAGDILAAATWSDRKIYVYNPQGGGPNKYKTFAWSHLGSIQQTALVSQDVVDYLRGNRAQEQSQTNGTLRTRTGVLGDIVNSAPVYVGKPNARLFSGAAFTGASSYGTFASAQASRTAAVYVGANDGMLHGFNASTGAELYAFVPNQVILNGLKQYSVPNYQHRYFVDGEITVADVYDSSGAGSWKTVLVGTLGRGGPGVFALDVTDPTDVKFLWEKNGTDISALGKNLGRPVIAQVANGDWRVLIGNGSGSSGASAQLVMIDAISGNVTVVNTGASGSNGLTAVLARDSNGDTFADVAYAGDLLGNLWKFSSLAGTAAVTKLFEARDPTNTQAITAAPLVGKNPADGSIWVFFGTGKYLSDNDLNTTQRQTWYGLKDTGSLISGRSALVERTLQASGTVGDYTTRTLEEGSVEEMAGQSGWYIDLPATGERMIVPNRFEGLALVGTTRIPDATDACRPSGRGFIMAINPFTGARLDQTFFDVSQDGQFTDSDKVNVNNQSTIVSGVSLDSSPNNPIFVDNVMQVQLDDGTTKTLKTQGASVEARRLSWRELLN